jgi:penicillin-binding protein 1C
MSLLTSAPTLVLRTLRKRRVVWGVLGSMLMLAALGWWALPFALPMPGRLKQPLPSSVTFLAADGTPLRQMLTPDGDRVTQVATYAELPVDLVHATMAAEDRRFFLHHGVDFSAITRALWDDLRAHRIVSGASTITQQLAKVGAEHRSSRNMSAKITEALQARRLEMTWSKERILSEYLNRVSYGNQFIGCASGVRLPRRASPGALAPQSLQEFPRRPASPALDSRPDA